MTAVEVKNIFEFISNIKLNKFDRDIRVIILSNYTRMSSFLKSQDEKIEALKNKIFTDKNITEIQKCLNNKTPISEELFEKQKEFNTVVNKLFEEECELKIDTIPEVDFVEALSNADIDFTPLDVIKLKPMLS